jgi:hypothetical protein
MLNSFQHPIKQTLKQVQGDKGKAFQATRQDYISSSASILEHFLTEVSLDPSSQNRYIPVTNT